MSRVLNLLLIWLLLVATPAWSLTTLYVDTDAVSPSPPTYSSLADAVAALPATLGDAYVIECSGSAADTTALSTLNVGTDATNTLIVRQAASDRHNGVWSDSKYRLAPTTGRTLALAASYVTIDGLQIDLCSDDAYQLYFYNFDHRKFINNLVRYSTDTYGYFRYLNAGDIIVNNIFFVPSTGTKAYKQVVSITTGTDGWLFANNTLVEYIESYRNCLIVNSAGSASRIYNNYIYTLSTSDDYAPASETSVDNMTADASGQITNQPPGDIFTDPANGDFTLKAGSAAIGAGADLSAYFTDDITGATRTTPWDIGAYKYATAATTPWHYYNGSAWIDATAYRYDGSAWQPITTKHYTGSAWE